MQPDRWPLSIAVLVLSVSMLTHPAFAAAAPPSQTQSADCSITVPPDTPNSKLKALAKITAEQAKAAAQAQLPGKVQHVRLVDDDGCLVYEVRIKAADGKVHEITVDAGNGKVIEQEIAEKKGDEYDD